MTLVVTCFREGRLLDRALRSVQVQADPSCEVVVVNDASPCAETNAVCAEWAQRGGARLVRRRRNGGLSAARNDGFRHARGAICAFLDADDELPAGAVQRILRAFDEYPSAAFVFGDYVRRDVEAGTEQLVDCRVLAGPDGVLDPVKLLRTWILSGHSPCRKEVWRAIGGYRQEFSYGYQDVDFWMRALAAGFRGQYVSGPIYQWNRSVRGMNEQRMARRRYHEARSVRYYETLGRDAMAWERIVTRYLDNIADPVFRREARQVWWSLLPARRSRVKPYLKLTVLAFSPSALLRLWERQRARSG